VGFFAKKITEEVAAVQMLRSVMRDVGVDG